MTTAENFKIHGRKRAQNLVCYRIEKKARLGYIVAPQATYAASSAQCVTNRVSVQSRPQPKPALTDFGLQPYVALNGHICCLIDAVRHKQGRRSV